MRSHALIEVRVKLGPQSVRRLLRAVETAFELTGSWREARVVVDQLGKDSDEFILGDCPLGLLDIRLSRRLFSNHRVPEDEFMPALSKSNKLLYVLMHEWGHGSDFRSVDTAKGQKRRCPCRLAFPKRCTDTREQYAESFAEWYLTKGTTDNVAARWYAAQNAWRADW